MKHILLFLAVAVSVNVFATKHTIVNSGTSFSPSTLTISQGDTVIFQLASVHNAVEVSKTTWDAQGTTSNGGFSLPNGGGTVVFPNSGTYYYVCQPHVASFNMKGTIIVNAASYVPELTNQKFESIYYLPSTNKINITFNLTSKAKVNYSIYDLSGKVIYNSEKVYPGAGKIEEQLSAGSTITKGAYILTAQIEGERRISGKFKVD